jgi:nitric oxide reductase activation protein
MLTKLLTEIPHVTIRLVSHELHQSIHVVHMESMLTLSGRLSELTFAHCSNRGPARARIITSNLVQSNSEMASHTRTLAISRQEAEQLANQNLLGIFNERDTAKRLAQMQATYDKNIAFYDPDKLIKGFDVINDFISQLLDSNPE